MSNAADAHVTMHEAVLVSSESKYTQSCDFPLSQLGWNDSFTSMEHQHGPDGDHDHLADGISHGEKARCPLSCIVEILYRTQVYL